MATDNQERRKVSPGLLAAVQTSPQPGDVEANLAAMDEALATLPAAPTRLIVFPEMACTGYFFPDRAHLRRAAEPVPDGPITRRLIELAGEHAVYLVAGLPEREGGVVYNTAVLVGPDGFITKYRKLHLWSEEKLFFEPGNLGLVVADLPFARVGLLICYDLWFPEQARILRLMGADVLAAPASLVWNDTPGHVKHGYYMASYVAMITAHLNQVHLAMASQVGHYGDKWLFGSSTLVGPVGWPLVEPAGDADPAALHAEVDFMDGRRLRAWGALDNFDQDRRTDVYGDLLGYRPKDG